jgi:hypothetical protein
MITEFYELGNIIYANDEITNIYYDFNKKTLRLTRIIYGRNVSRNGEEITDRITECNPKCVKCKSNLYFIDEMIWCNKCGMSTFSEKCPAWYFRKLIMGEE